MTEKGKLRHIGHPFLVRFFGREIPAQYIRCHLPNVAAIGTIFLHPHPANCRFFLFVFVGTLVVFDPIIISASRNGSHLDQVDDFEIMP